MSRADRKNYKVLHNFYYSLFRFLLSFNFDWKEKLKARKTRLSTLWNTLKFRQKYSTTPLIFNFPRCLEILYITIVSANYTRKSSSHFSLYRQADQVNRFQTIQLNKERNDGFYHLLGKTRLVDDCSQWDASNLEWTFPRGCARSI